MLPDGRILMRSINTNKTAIYNPSNNTWSAGSDKKSPSSSEETWTLLPDEATLEMVANGISSAPLAVAIAFPRTSLESPFVT